MDTNSISSFFVNYTWTGNDGVDPDPRWHRVTERSHTPPLLKEVCLTEGHINFTFTSIEESPEKCGTSFDVPSKQAMWFVDKANSATLQARAPVHQGSQTSSIHHSHDSVVLSMEARSRMVAITSHMQLPSRGSSYS